MGQANDLMAASDQQAWTEQASKQIQNQATAPVAEASQEGQFANQAQPQVTASIPNDNWYDAGPSKHRQTREGEIPAVQMTSNPYRSASGNQDSYSGDQNLKKDQSS